jgi:hypothetical protein
MTALARAEPAGTGGLLIHRRPVYAESGHQRTEGIRTRRGVGNPTAGCSRYPNLSDEKRGAAPLLGRIALHITRQLVKTRFPKLVRRSRRHRRERGEGADGGQGFPEVVHTLGSQVRATGCHRSATGPSLVPCRAGASTHNSQSLELGGR